MGVEENRRKQEQQQRTANAAADATAVSWATRDGKGQIPQIQWNDSSLMGNALKGGLSGYMQGHSLGAMGGGADKAVNAAATGASAANNYSNVLGGQDMGAQLGAMGQQQSFGAAGPAPLDWNQQAEELKKPNLFGGGQKPSYGLGAKTSF